MIVKAFEQGTNKIYMRADNMDNFSVLVIDGNKSQRIASTKNNHVDFDTASELFDLFVDKAQKNDDTKIDTIDNSEVFSPKEFEQLLKDLENEDKKGNK